MKQEDSLEYLEYLEDKVMTENYDYLNEKGYLRQNWQPIKNAQKDDGNIVFLSFWDKNNFLSWVTVGRFCKKRKTWRYRFEGLLKPPTHFMPLPENPRE